MARPKKPAKRPTRRGKRFASPRTETQFRALPERSKDTLERVLRVVSKLRTEKTSLKRASQEIGVNPQTVKRWATSALKKRNGRFVAKSSDQLFRVLKIPDEKGLREVTLRGSRQATLLAEYWNALNRYLQTGDASRLEKFRHKFIKDADGLEIPLPTDRAVLKRLGSAGNISFESIYSRTV